MIPASRTIAKRHCAFVRLVGISKADHPRRGAHVDGGAGGRTGAAPVAAHVIQVFAPDQRQPAPAVTGELLDGVGRTTSADMRRRGGGQLLGQLVRPVRGRGRTTSRRPTRPPKANGVAFLGVNVRDETDAAAAVRRTAQAPTRPLRPVSRLALGFAVPPTAIPATLILDRQGRHRRRGTARPVVQRASLEPGGDAELAARERRDPRWVRPSPASPAAGRCCWPSAWPRSPGWSASCRRACCRWCPATCPT